MRLAIGLTYRSFFVFFFCFCFFVLFLFLLFLFSQLNSISSFYTVNKTNETGLNTTLIFH